MQLKFAVPAIAALSLTTASFAQDQNVPPFTPDQIRAHVTFLADDLLEGRQAGTRGFDVAAKYVATHFEALGLRPAVNGDWYQQVPLRKAELVEPAKLTIGGRTFDNLGSVVIGPHAVDVEQNIEAPVVFVGFGLDMPDRGFNDYAGLDVRGKVVAVLSGFPAGTPSELGAHLNSEKVVMAEKRGAIGMVTLRTLAEQKRRPWKGLTEYGAQPTVGWIQKDGQPYRRAPLIRLTATLDNPASEALFEGAPQSFPSVLQAAQKEGGRPKGFPLKQTVRIERKSRMSSLSSPNVLAFLPGADPALAGEYVVMTAHLDHEGMSPKSEGDKVFNGALDNAMGVAMLLEVARALSTSPQRPRRSILFAAVTGEEMGLVGSHYLAKHPVVGSGRIVAVVNVDMPILLYDFKDVIAYGAEHSTLGPLVARVAKAANVQLAPDPQPQEGRFTRSDHYSLVREGVPAVSMKTGFAGEGEAKIKDFTAKHYHQPSDQLDLPINWPASARFAEINYRITREIADADERPLWYSGNFFGNMFAPGQKKAPIAPK